MQIIELFAYDRQRPGMLEEVGKVEVPDGVEVDIIGWGNRYFYRDPETDTFIEGRFLQCRMSLFPGMGVFE